MTPSTDDTQRAAAASRSTLPAEVRCTGMRKSFGQVTAVDGATFSVEEGSVLALLGPSGCGKTTTLRLIAGFETPDAGTVEIAGTVVAGNGRFVPAEHRRVGMVFQDYALFPHLTVRGNIAYGLPRGPERDRRMDEVLELVGMTATGERMPHQLSGGQQQRVALARALAPNPSVILLDEPFSNLDPTLRGRVREEVKRILREARSTAIFVTHDQEEAFALADSVGVMLAGQVVQMGSPEAVYADPATMEVASFIGDANILHGEASGDRVSCELGELPLKERANGPVKVMVRPQTIRLHPEVPGTANATVVDRQFYGYYQVMQLRLETGSTVRALMGVQYQVEPGDAVRVGVNGAATAFRAHGASGTAVQAG